MRKLLVILILVFGLSFPLHYNTIESKPKNAVNYVLDGEGNGFGDPDTPVPIVLT